MQHQLRTRHYRTHVYTLTSCFALLSFCFNPSPPVLELEMVGALHSTFLFCIVGSCERFIALGTGTVPRNV